MQVADAIKKDLEAFDFGYSETFITRDGLVFRTGAKEEGDPFVSIVPCRSVFGIWKSTLFNCCHCFFDYRILRWEYLYGLSHQTMGGGWHVRLVFTIYCNINCVLNVVASYGWADSVESPRRQTTKSFLFCWCNHFLWQAYQRGLRYPTHQFFILAATGGAWLVEPDPAAELGCSLEERIDTLRFALTVSIPGTSESRRAPFGGLVRFVNNNCWHHCHLLLWRCMCKQCWTRGDVSSHNDKHCWMVHNWSKWESNINSMTTVWAHKKR